MSTTGSVPPVGTVLLVEAQDVVSGLMFFRTFVVDTEDSKIAEDAVRDALASDGAEWRSFDPEETRLVYLSEVPPEWKSAAIGRVYGASGRIWVDPNLK